MKTAKIIFPHQLFKENPLFETAGNYFLVEEFLFFRQYPFHQQKIAFHRATMKFYENFLQEKSITVEYIESLDERAEVRKLLEHLHQNSFEAIEIIHPEDDWLMRRIQHTCNSLKLELIIHDSPMFLNTAAELQPFFSPSKKKFFQTEFYKQQRLSRMILLDKKGGPEGGQWTYDTENRKKYPKGKAVPQVVYPVQNAFQKEAQAYVKKHFSDHLGQIDNSCTYPVTFKESEAWLRQFLEKRFAEFGDYEDAIVHQELLLNHSLLTPMLNVGLLTPHQILEEALDHGKKHSIPLNSLEGFVRQILGWREFIRGVYVAKGREERTRNFWGFNKKIPQSFYDGTTGILPVDETIRKVIETGYCHHIERLMVLGNFMLLCEFDPDEIYRWFMELFIDAYDWVMVPNVYGMSQFADGGLMSTKPYLSGSNYLIKMSDYPKGEWQETWDALFWRFMDVHRDFFLKNPRLGMLIRTFDKWDAEKKTAVHEKAEKFLKSLN